LPWERILGWAKYNNPTDTVVGDSNQKKTRRQSDKTPDNREKERGCVYVTMPGELVQRVIEASTTWPEGWTGELGGMVRMLGGGMMNTKGPNSNQRDRDIVK